MSHLLRALHITRHRRVELLVFVFALVPVTMCFGDVRSAYGAVAPSPAFTGTAPPVQGVAGNPAQSGTQRPQSSASAKPIPRATPTGPSSPGWWVYASLIVAAMLLGAAAAIVILMMMRRAEGKRWELESARAMYDRTRAQLEDLREQLARQDLERATTAHATAVPAQETAVEKPPPPERQPFVPNIPDELVEALAGGAAVLFAGSGLASRSGVPSWPIFLENLAREVAARDGSGESAELYQAAIAKGSIDEIAQLLAQDLNDGERLAAMADTYGVPRKIPSAFALLSEIPFAYAITTALYDLLERAFRVHRPVAVLTGDGERLDDALRWGTFGILKLHGDLADPATIRFTNGEYRSSLVENPTFAKTMASLALARPVLYVGATAEEVQTFLVDSVRQRPDRPHFALVPDDAGSRVAAHLLTSRYNVTLLPYVEGPKKTEVYDFLWRLKTRVAAARPAPTSGGESGRAAPEDACISRVAISNIGPFEEVALDLNPHWNVVLGINGAGKSTILKAIALCLCGDDPGAVAAAQHILKAGAEKGSITLTMGTATYRTDLLRERGRVRLTAHRLTPLQRGAALALGFPALRAASPGDPKGPEQAERRWPESYDLLPLLDPAADRRLGSFKQWIVNLVARAADEPDAGRRAKIERTRDVAFSVVRRLSGNAGVRFARVDKETWRVLVATPDTPELSLDLVSQGMTSLLAWVGVALERFSEINPGVERPEEIAALILIDEIDAHLHPSWQRELVGVLRDIFPNLQVIATTHSPLIIGGMRADEVFVSRRDVAEPTKLELEPLQVKFKGMRVDQILATSAFDLPSSRDPDSARKFKEYEALVYKTNRSREEDARFKKLSDEIDAFYYAGVTEEAREAEQRDAERTDDPNSDMNRFLADDLTPEERQAVLDAMAAQTAKSGS